MSRRSNWQRWRSIGGAITGLLALACRARQKGHAVLCQGVVWPREAWRGAGVVFASIMIKPIAITHFLWSGLAFGLVLHPLDYLFVVVFLGFLTTLSRLARNPGAFLVGAIFALDLLGVPDEQALVMVLLVQFSSLLAVASIGAFALWRSGIALDELHLAKGNAVGRL